MSFIGNTTYWHWLPLEATEESPEQSGLDASAKRHQKADQHAHAEQLLDARSDSEPQGA